MALRRSGVRSPSAPPTFLPTWACRSAAALGNDPGPELARFPRRRRRRNQALVANTVVEPDPVDPLPAAPCVAIAQLHPPDRRILLADIFERRLPSVVLAIHATSVPVTDEADVEKHRVVQWRRRIGPCAGRAGGDRRHQGCSRERPSHCRQSDKGRIPLQERGVMTPECWRTDTFGQLAAAATSCRFHNDISSLIG